MATLQRGAVGQLPGGAILATGCPLREWNARRYLPMKVDGVKQVFYHDLDANTDAN
ncbi:MAG: hypothetical protein U1F20_10495 [Lysobacterales bacterium]